MTDLFASYFCCLSSLSLSAHLILCCMQIWIQPESVTKRLATVFSQLTFVHLDKIPEVCDLTWTLFILEAAPNLKELYLTVS
jgi:hypothetical protein